MSFENLYIIGPAVVRSSCNHITTHPSVNSWNPYATSPSWSKPERTELRISAYRSRASRHMPAHIVMTPIYVRATPAHTRTWHDWHDMTISYRNHFCTINCRSPPLFDILTWNIYPLWASTSLLPRAISQIKSPPLVTWTPATQLLLPLVCAARVDITAIALGGPSISSLPILTFSIVNILLI